MTIIIIRTKINKMKIKDSIGMAISKMSENMMVQDAKMDR